MTKSHVDFKMLGLRVQYSIGHATQQGENPQVFNATAVPPPTPRPLSNAQISSVREFLMGVCTYVRTFIFTLALSFPHPTSPSDHAHCACPPHPFFRTFMCVIFLVRKNRYKITACKFLFYKLLTFEPPCWHLILRVEKKFVRSEKFSEDFFCFRWREGTGHWASSILMPAKKDVSC